MQLHRAVAYQCETATTLVNKHQPEVTVFFEVQPTDTNPARLLQHLLAMVWHCPVDDVESYNLWCEAELLANSTLHHTAGDARLLETGWHHGPLFCHADRTLLLVRPLTQLRLLDARRRARPFQAQQMVAAGIGAGSHYRPGSMAADVAQRAAFQSLSDMGGTC